MILMSPAGKAKESSISIDDINMLSEVGKYRKLSPGIHDIPPRLSGLIRKQPEIDIILLLGVWSEEAV